MSASSRTTELQRCIDNMLDGDDSYRQKLIDHAYERLRLLVKKRMAMYPSVRRWEQTDDVLQQASIRLWKSLEKVKPPTVREFFKFAATQIRRTLIDLARHYGGPQGIGAKHATNERPGNAGREQPEKPDETDEPAALVEWSEFHETVEVLPENQREIFDLLYYNGLTQPEASELTGIPLRTLKRQWRSTRETLYKAMHGEPPGNV